MIRRHAASIGAATSRGVLVAALLFPAACIAACSATSKPAGTAPASHSMQADRLHEVMKSFDAAVRRSVATEVDSYNRWEGVFREMADAAEALEASAIELSGHPPGKLELTDRGRFQVLARSLATAAGDLRDAAARGDADAVESSRRALGTACRDCHERFRPGSPGVPDAFR